MTKTQNETPRADGKGDREMKYLISAETHFEARIIAQDMQLQPIEWIFIPWERPYPPRGGEFRQRLCGYIGFTPDHLIGEFSEYETMNLTRKTS